MERKFDWGNLQALNMFMTNEHISFRANDLLLEVLWVAFPAEKETGSQHGERPPRWHSHSFCEVHYCLEGSYVYRLASGEELRMGAGDTVLIRERVEHGQCAVAPGARKLSFAYRLMENQTVYNRDAQQQARDALVIQDGGRLLELFQRVSEEFNDRRMGYRDVIGSLLFQIAMEYERHISVRPSEDAVAARINQRAEEIMLFINGNLTRNITTNDVADTLHLSKRQINRIVLREFGTSCTNVIRQTKHKKAQELLLYSDKSIQDIAALLGYSNVYSFSKFFKSEEGLPPALFRRSHYSY